MGGLVKDIREFYDPFNDIGGERWYEQVAIHWEDASRRHGMPVDSSVFYEIKDSFTSTYPANIAVKAAELQDKEMAKRYLRRLREAAAAERKHIHKIEVQVELAREVGLDTSQFIEDISNGRAKDAFLKDLKECRQMGITGFPTFLVKSLKNDRKYLVQGYRKYEYFEKLLDEFTNYSLEKRRIEKSEEEVFSFVNRWRKVATQEVATLLDITKEKAYQILKSMSEKGLIYVKKAGNDYFWLARPLAICDPVTGVCKAQF